MTIAPEHRDVGGVRAAGGPGSTGDSARAWRGTALVALFLWTLAASGCGDSGGTAANELPLRTDTQWQLESFRPNGGPITLVPDPTLYTVRFGGDGRVGIRADCNRCAGTYQIAGAGLTIGPLACTLAACPLPSLGTQFTDALTRVSSYVQTPGELSLVHAGGTLRLLAAQ
jgi:heat shock protein HslJ